MRYSYPKLFTGAEADGMCKTPLAHADEFCASWRGGGFRDDFREFFDRMIGKFYRVPGFLATSLDKNTALEFIGRADKAHPRVLWCILVRVTI